MQRKQNILQIALVVMIIGLIAFFGWWFTREAAPPVKVIAPAVGGSGKVVKFTKVKTDSEDHKEPTYGINGTKLTLYLGTRSTGGYGYSVDKILKTANQLDVYTIETKPGRSCIVTQSLTYPATTVELESYVTEKVVVHTSIKIHECK